MRIDIPAFLASLQLMAEGMLGIFAVMAILIGVVCVLGRLTRRRGGGEA